MRIGRGIAAGAVACAACGASASPPSAPAAATTQTIHVDVTPGHAVNTFRPLTAMGAGIDRLPTRATDRLYAAPTLDEVLSAGWGAVTYRLNTELHIEAWHWNPHGTWSDADGARGYFSGDATPGDAPIVHSFGYTLPRRGVTRNDGTEEHGFSRLTDGDPATIWKSNPYLSKAFTGEDDDRFPQWLVIDLERTDTIDTLQIDWAAPYARRYTVAYWTGDDAIKQPTRGEWRAFPGGEIRDGRGGRDLRALAPAPLAARFVRIELTGSSETCAVAADRRDCVGFAVAELHLGRRDADGTFHDLLRHSPDQQQSATFCSSIDPWHQAGDLAAHGDQTGFDRFYTSGVTRGLPAMIPVSVLYGTPDDAAHQIAYLEQRGYPISYVELGEEPDGQYMTPEHYAQLYLQWATALHAVDPRLKLGGPVFTGQNEDIVVWPDRHGDASWLGRFIKYLDAHHRLADLAFVSFEHYPHGPCKIGWDDLYDEPRLIRHVIDLYRRDGVPRSVPLLVTEVNLAWQVTQEFVDSFGGLWLADYLGAFFTAGGAASFYFHYLPFPLTQECAGTWGTFGMFTASDDLAIEQRTSQYHVARMLTQEWVQPGDGEHRVVPATSDVVDASGRVVVTAYALARPDGQWSLLLVNKDPVRAHAVRVQLEDAAAHRARGFAGPVAMTVFGRDQYVWHADGAAGHADPDRPPLTTRVDGGATAYTLPPASVTVLRGRIDGTAVP